MKKSIKKTISIVLTIAMMAIGTVAYANRIPKPGSAPTEATNIAKNALGLVQVFAYAIAVGMIIYLAIKYMMAPANEKADLKNSSIKYVIGAVLVCAAATIANIIVGIGEGITGGK